MQYQPGMAGRADDVHRALAASGYRPGAPDDFADFQADECQAEQMICPVCLTYGLYARGYRNGKPLGYRAIAVCPRCSHAEEF